jgi:hypothetical protein
MVKMVGVKGISRANMPRRKNLSPLTHHVVQGTHCTLSKEAYCLFIHYNTTVEQKRRQMYLYDVRMFSIY